MQKNLFEMWTKMLFQYTDNLTMFFPIFHNSLNVGLRSVMFTRWQMQYTERDAKQVLKTRFYSNYFTCYNGTDAQGLFQIFDLHVDSSIWFRY